ncbi:MAG: GNAT family N-acetyltransferase [Anaerolineae bacterium]|jgi:GNAT superfamily N-acetyltransferase
MIYEIETDDFERARPLFREVAAFQPFCGAVLAGIYPGRVFVDDADRPRAGFLFREDGWCFLAGDPEAAAFNRALNEAIWSRQAVDEGLTRLLITSGPGERGRQLAAILAPREPVPARRRHYVGRELAFDGRAHLPEGAALEPMDETLLGRQDVQVPDQVAETIQTWRSLAGPAFHDYGFVAIVDDRVASWATVDGVVEGFGDAGLFTLPRYRRRGLATAVSAATVAHGLARGMKAINWTCAADNVASIRVAEKLGFARQPDYTLYFMAFDEVEHLGTLAYTHLHEGRYRQAIAIYETSIDLQGNPPPWVYYDAAQAYAGLGDRQQALAYLQKSVAGGWTHVEDEAEFTILHDTAEWATIQQQLKKAAD